MSWASVYASAFGHLSLSAALTDTCLHASAGMPDVHAGLPSVHAQPHSTNKVFVWVFPSSSALCMVANKHVNEQCGLFAMKIFAVHGPGDGGELLGDGQGPQPVGSHSQVAGFLRLHSATCSQGSKQSAAAAVFRWRPSCHGWLFTGVSGALASPAIAQSVHFL